MRRLFALLIALAPVAAHGASLDTGNELMQACSSFALNTQTADWFAKGVCAGEIRGIAELASAEGKICFPANSTVGQDAMIVLKYMWNHPETNHYQFSAIVWRALREAFPCGRPKIY